jgi:hypothetical protein
MSYVLENGGEEIQILKKKQTKPQFKTKKNEKKKKRKSHQNPNFPSLISKTQKYS